MNQRVICKLARPLQALPLVLLTGLLLAPVPRTCAQQQATAGLPSVTERIALPPAFPDSSLRLKHRFLAAGSESVTAASGTLRPGVDYRMELGSGILTVRPGLLAQLRVEHPGDSLVFIISYRYVPLQVQDVYRKRTLASPSAPVTGKDSLRIARPTRGFSMDDVFGSQLQKSGSIVRGFTVGSNRDL